MKEAMESWLTNLFRGFTSSCNGGDKDYEKEHVVKNGS